MKATNKFTLVPLTLILGFLSFCTFSFVSNSYLEKKPLFPYKQAGLTERQAAAHLISRFTYGARPGDVDAVVKMGLEKWFVQQLNGNIPDEDLLNRLNDYDALKLSNAEILAKYPRPANVLRMAVKEGVIKKDSLIFLIRQLIEKNWLLTLHKKVLNHSVNFCGSLPARKL